MICKSCREGVHVGCADMDRAIPAMIPMASMWCDCQHEPREASL